MRCEPYPAGHYLWNESSPSFLGQLGLGPGRPNQALARGIYGGAPNLRGLRLGQDDDDGSGISVDPTLLLAGAGLLALVMFLAGGRAVPALKRSEARRLRRRAARVEATI